MAFKTILTLGMAGRKWLHALRRMALYTLLFRHDGPMRFICRHQGIPLSRRGKERNKENNRYDGGNKQPIRFPQPPLHDVGVVRSSDIRPLS